MHKKKKYYVIAAIGTASIQPNKLCAFYSLNSRKIIMLDPDYGAQTM